jgi:hypothetical protein
MTAADRPYGAVGSGRIERAGDGAVSGKPSSGWYHLKLLDTSATPMIVHVRFIGSSLETHDRKRFEARNGSITGSREMRAR